MVKSGELNLIDERFQFFLLLAGELNKLQTGNPGVPTAVGLIFRRLVNEIDLFAGYPEELEAAGLASGNIYFALIDGLIGHGNIFKFQSPYADTFDYCHFIGSMIKHVKGRFRDSVTPKFPSLNSHGTMVVIREM